MKNKIIIIMMAIAMAMLAVGCGKVMGPAAAPETAVPAVSRVDFVEPDGVAYAKGVQGPIQVLRKGEVLEMTEGMELLDDDQVRFTNRRTRFDVQSSIADVPVVTIFAGEEGYWDAETGHKLPPDPDWSYCRGISYSAFW